MCLCKQEDTVIVITLALLFNLPKQLIIIILIETLQAQSKNIVLRSSLTLYNCIINSKAIATIKHLLVVVVV